MIIDLKKIKRSGKDSADFYFEYEPELDLIEIPNAKLVVPVTISGSVTLTGEHSCYVDGEVVFSIKGECTRCLKETLNRYVIEFSECADSEAEDGYPVKNDTVDLTKIVDDVILMNEPVSFLCKEDCKGICLNCGTNLNDGECKCKN
ncbi:MAG: DUF177 domain-containing protein [Clostridia bacterium]|nr:DUF177 domain-containing protein [Clostridia bacterium]